MDPFIPRLSKRGLRMPIYRDTPEFDHWLAWQKHLRATGRVAEADTNMREQPLLTKTRRGAGTFTGCYAGLARQAAS